MASSGGRKYRGKFYSGRDIRKSATLRTALFNQARQGYRSAGGFF